MTIPENEMFKWERFKKQEADLLFIRDQAMASNDNETLEKVYRRLYDLTRNWVHQFMIWEGSPDFGDNEIYQKLRKAVNDGEILPDKVPRQYWTVSDPI